MKEFIFFTFIFFCYFIFLEKIKVEKKFLPFFFLNIFLYFIILFFNHFVLKIKKSIKQSQEIKKQKNEIPKLIEYMKSYVKSGLQPSQIVKILAQKKIWCVSIQKKLNDISNYNLQGTSFEQSVNMAIQKIVKTKSNQHFIFLLSALRLGHITGGNLISILEKVKLKTENSILIERKIKVTTAHMRLQSAVISLAPCVLALVLWVINPQYIEFFFTNPLGNFLFFIMILMNFIGFYFLKSIAKIES
jgi:tight adherence protein B